jgi:K+-transporting ATPase ATPase A chain
MPTRRRRQQRLGLRRPDANTAFYNTTLGIAMLLGRFAIIIPMLADRRLARRQEEPSPASAGTFPTHGRCSSACSSGVILIVGGLTFFPALALGPIASTSRCRRQTF